MSDLWVLYDGDATYGTCKVVSDDAGACTLTVDALAISDLSTTGDVTFTLGAGEAFTLTCSDISAPMVMTNTMTTAAKTGCRALFNVKANVALGSFCNAVKGFMEFTGTSGATTGLASGVCAELKTPNRTLPSGAYYPLEVEHVAGGTSVVSTGSGSRVGFIYMENSADLDGDFDDNGYLMTVAGLTAGAGHILSAQSITLKAQVGLAGSESTRYLVMSSAENNLTLATTGGTSISIGSCTTGISITGTMTTGLSIAADGAFAVTVTTGFSGTAGFYFQGTADDGIAITGICGDGISVSGAATAAAIHILGDQVDGILMDVDASWDSGITMSCDTTYTVTAGLEMSGAGTFTTGILLSATAITTGITISAGSLTDGILISGATPVDGIQIGSACSGIALNLSGANATGIALSGANTVGGIVITGAYAAGHALAIGTFGTPVVYGADELIELHGQHGAAADAKPMMRVRCSGYLSGADTGIIMAGQFQAYGTGTNDSTNVVGLNVEVGFKGNSELLTGGVLRGGLFKVEDMGFDITLTGDVYAIQLGWQMSGTTTVSGESSYINVNKEGAVNQDCNSIVRMQDASGSGVADHLLDFVAVTLPIAVATGAVGSTTHKIAIDVAGTTRYLVVYDNVS